MFCEESNCFEEDYSPLNLGYQNLLASRVQLSDDWKVSLKLCEKKPSISCNTVHIRGVQETPSQFVPG